MIGIKKCCDKFIAQNKKYKIKLLKAKSLPYVAYEIKKNNFFINETIIVVACDNLINDKNIEKISLLLTGINNAKGVTYIVAGIGDSSLTAKDCLYFSNEKSSYVHYVLITENGALNNKSFHYAASASVKKLIDIISDDLNNMLPDVKNLIKNEPEDDFVKITG